MKKIMTIALGLGLVIGLTTASFAQDHDKDAKSTKSSKTTKAPTKSTSKM